MAVPFFVRALPPPQAFPAECRRKLFKTRGYHRLRLPLESPRFRNLRLFRSLMAKREYSNYQQKVIKRYYDNREAIDDQRLSELVTNLYLADSEKKQAKLWESAGTLMERLEVPPSRIEHVVQTRDPAILAEVVKDLQKGRIGPEKK